MSSISEQIVKVAEGYIGTPFQHQQAQRGIGIDCVNFIGNVATETGAIADANFDNDYRRRADGSVMLRLLEKYMDYVPLRADVAVADVVAFHDGKFLDEPRHLAFIVGVTGARTYICHASERGVVRHRMDESWWRKVHSIWRIRNIS